MTRGAWRIEWPIKYNFLLENFISKSLLSQQFFSLTHLSFEVSYLQSVLHHTRKSFAVPREEFRERWERHLIFERDFWSLQNEWESKTTSHRLILDVGSSPSHSLIINFRAFPSFFSPDASSSPSWEEEDALLTLLAPTDFFSVLTMDSVILSVRTVFLRSRLSLLSYALKTPLLSKPYLMYICSSEENVLREYMERNHRLILTYIKVMWRKSFHPSSCPF